MAESELRVLSRQCLNRRLADHMSVAHEVAAWETRRNADGIAVDWRFTTPEARLTLHRLSPVIHG